MALIGTRLIEFRVNRRSEQMAQLIGMARMAMTLDAITADEFGELLNELDRLIAEGVAHV